MRTNNALRSARNALRVTIGIAAACLLAGRVASAQGTSTYTTPGAPSAAPPATAPSVTPPDRIGVDAGPDTRGTVETGPTNSQDTAPADTRASSDRASSDGTAVQSGTGSLQDDAPVAVAGRVDSVDRADDTIEIEGVDRQLKLDSSTQVTRNGAQASFSDVQEGEQVRASFDDGFPARVRRIEIMAPSSATGAAGTAAPPDRATAPDTGTMVPDRPQTTTPPATTPLPRRDTPSTTRESTGIR